jgi:hypothetical protein
MPKANGARGHPGPGRGKTGSPVSRPFCAEPTIKDFGITHVQSAQWQKLADVPEEEFEAEIANPVALPSAAIIIAAHEARNRPEAPPSKPVDSRALWLWGRLLDFKRDGLLTVDPNELLNTMLGGMENDTRELAPLVSAWLGRIGQ